MTSRLGEMAQDVARDAGGAVHALEVYFGHEIREERLATMTEQTAMNVLELKLFALELQRANRVYHEFGASNIVRERFAASLVEERGSA